MEASESDDPTFKGILDVITVNIDDLPHHVSNDSIAKVLEAEYKTKGLMLHCELPIVVSTSAFSDHRHLKLNLFARGGSIPVGACFRLTGKEVHPWSAPAFFARFYLVDPTGKRVFAIESSTTGVEVVAGRRNNTMVHVSANLVRYPLEEDMFLQRTEELLPAIEGILTHEDKEDFYRRSNSKFVLLSYPPCHSLRAFVLVTEDIPDNMEILAGLPRNSSTDRLGNQHHGWHMWSAYARASWLRTRICSNDASWTEVVFFIIDCIRWQLAYPNSDYANYLCYFKRMTTHNEPLNVNYVPTDDEFFYDHPALRYLPIGQELRRLEGELVYYVEGEGEYLTEDMPEVFSGSFWSMCASVQRNGRNFFPTFFGYTVDSLTVRRRPPFGLHYIAQAELDPHHDMPPLMQMYPATPEPVIDLV